ncbi:MAG: HAD-IIIA family hydrolase [Gemmatimonadetes bacterium]|nr:HAD-IIIA family hydrolase [Gemmatimonadota bacterium]MBM4191166.1 HAD-IIIA family hydrolase [Gemmatimonadota bacterium]
MSATSPAPASATAAITPALARRIRLVCFDVDGVLTDGGIILGDAAGSRVELKRYDIQDGLGVVLLRQAGIRTAIITGRESQSVALRAEELHVDDVIQDRHARKVPALAALIERLGFSWDEVAFVGDDLPDLGVLRRVGLPVCVGNATAEVRRVASVQLTRHGGAGAVREFVELLLTARGEWVTQVEAYVASREREA